MGVLSLHVKHCAHKCYTLLHSEKKFPRRAFAEQNENLSNCPRTNYVHHYFLLFSDHGVLWTIDWLFIQTMNNVLVQKRGKVWSLGLVFSKKKSPPFYLYANVPWSWVKHGLYLVPTTNSKSELVVLWYWPSFTQDSGPWGFFQSCLNCETQRFTDQKLSSTIFTCCPASVTSAFMPIYIDFEHWCQYL